MASRGRLHAGGSFGRIQAVVNWILGNFSEFDAWCLIKGIDPIEIPGYRFYNLALYFLKEDREEDYLELLNQELDRLDFITSPFQRENFKVQIQSQETIRTRTVAQTRHAPDSPKRVNVDSSKGSTLEDRNTSGYVPKWWQGDNANYLTAKKMMGSPLPKMG